MNLNLKKMNIGHCKRGRKYQIKINDTRREQVSRFNNWRVIHQNNGTREAGWKK